MAFRVDGRFGLYFAVTILGLLFDFQTTPDEITAARGPFTAASRTNAFSARCEDSGQAFNPSV
jgi:hypothetical protein